MQAIEGAVIACAGLGSRLGMGLPKCMIEVGGQTILRRSIESLRPLVPRIHVVVGYREELVVEYCARYHRDVVLVRNADFLSTSTAHSFCLGSLGFSGKVLYLDGDLVIDPKSLRSFLDQAARVELLIGITPTKSSQAVLVSTTETSVPQQRKVTRFYRGGTSTYEWANVFSGPPGFISSDANTVYECLASSLPAPGQEIALFEVDTPEDLELANAGVATFSP